jgi:hypothetical protein
MRGLRIPIGRDAGAEKVEEFGDVAFGGVQGRPDVDVLARRGR